MCVYIDIFLNKFPAFRSFGGHRLQNSEQEREQSDQSDRDMRVELEGKVDDLQKQLTDLDTLRLRGKSLCSIHSQTKKYEVLYRGITLLQISTVLAIKEKSANAEDDFKHWMNMAKMTSQLIE